MTKSDCNYWGAIVFLTLFFIPLHSQSQKINSFWTEFKIAVINKDTIKVASFVEFAPSNGLIGKDSSEFYKNFNSLFDEKTVEIMKKTEELQKSGNNSYIFVGSGAYKFFSFKKKGGKFKLYNVKYYD